MARARGIWEELRYSLWLIPAILAGLAVVLALGLLAVDERVQAAGTGIPLVFSGSPDGARSVLSTIASSILTFTGLVFTVTMLVLQLASAQLSPRVMRTFLRDRGNQVVLGLFIATFVYTLIVLREVHAGGPDAQPFVPSISVWFSFGLLLASIAAFIWYIDHMAQAIRATTVLANIWRETHRAVDERFPDPPDGDHEDEDQPDDAGAESAGEPVRGGTVPRPPDGSGRIINADSTGTIAIIDHQALLSLATGDRRIRVLRAVGWFAPEGIALIEAWGDWDDDALDRARGAITIEQERSIRQDPTFGFRQLVDVALRSLGTNTDPSTAVEALDHLHALLRSIVRRPFPPRRFRDDDGEVRVWIPGPGWATYVHLAVDEIRAAGSGQIEVLRRLGSMLSDLAAIAPPDRKGVLREELQMVRDLAQRSLEEARDQERAMAPIHGPR